jgi:hypothetical protein
MTFVTPNTRTGDANGPAEKPRHDSREEGTADVVDVPQADGNSTAKPADVVKHADKPVTTV